MYRKECDWYVFGHTLNTNFQSENGDADGGVVKVKRPNNRSSLSSDSTLTVLSDTDDRCCSLSCVGCEGRRFICVSQNSSALIESNVQGSSETGTG